MHPDDISKSVITSPFGLCEYNYMLFELKNATATKFCPYIVQQNFQRHCVFLYIDDILIFSDDKISHKKTLTMFLKYSMIMT